MLGTNIIVFLFCLLVGVLLYYFRIVSLKIVVAVLALVFIATHWTKISASFQTPEPFDPKIQLVIDKLNAKESPVIQPIPKIIIQIWVDRDDLGRSHSDRDDRSHSDRDDRSHSDREHSDLNRDTKNKNKSQKIPKDQIGYMNKMRQMNPGFQHLFFDTNDVKQFFESNYPEYYDTYKRLPAFIQKLDFFRYLVVYHYGGFYFDMDVEPKKPLDASITNHQAVFPIDEYGKMDSCPERMASTCKKGRPFLLGQYAFGATAKHPFLKYVVDKIRNNVDTYIKVAKKVENEEREHAHYYVYKTTGPDFVTDCYNRYDKPEQFYILSNGKRQVFGDYATHNYAGTWK
jgi:mannosyltransferase OCH1-like enzyme